MGLWDVIRGQRAAKRPNLDNLFALPGASITLQTAMALAPTGTGSVCFRAAEGSASVASESDAEQLIEGDGGPPVERRVDEFGFTWLVVRRPAEDVSSLVTDLHAVNTTLEANGFADGLLCSLLGFTDGQRKVGLVYLYKRGTFYPFCPNGPRSRDTLLERQVRDTVSGDLPIEPDTARWLPIWGAEID